MPWADALYGCDARWWNVHKDCDGFTGVKWSSHEQSPDGKPSHTNDKREVAEKYGIRLVNGTAGAGFSTNPELIHYGDNSGFQSVNLAILFGSPYIVLVGFDMRHIGGKSHFFGDHPTGVFQRGEYESFAAKFDKAPPPDGVTIINATPGSALKCYPMMELETAIQQWQPFVASAQAQA
jgi:hypothetical protein